MHLHNLFQLCQKEDTTQSLIGNIFDYYIFIKQLKLPRIYFLVCVFTFLIPCCDVRYDFSSCLYELSCLIVSFCMLAYSDFQYLIVAVLTTILPILFLYLNTVIVTAGAFEP